MSDQRTPPQGDPFWGYAAGISAGIAGAAATARYDTLACVALAGAVAAFAAFATPRMRYWYCYGSLVPLRLLMDSRRLRFVLAMVIAFMLLLWLASPAYAAAWDRFVLPLALLGVLGKKQTAERS